MNAGKKKRLPWWLACCTPLLSLSAGCLSDSCGKDSHALDNCSTIPAGAIPFTAGAHTRQIADAQAAKAEADDFVINKHEWYMGGKELGPYGRYHVQSMIPRLPEVPFPVLVQVDADPKLNETRRQAVVQFLTAAGVPNAEQRVILGYPEAEGLYGEEAERIYQQAIGGSQAQPYGPANNQFGPNNFFGGNRNTFRGNRPGGGGLGLGGFPF